MADQDKNTKFSTDSYVLASFLLSESCKLTSLDRTNPKRIVFIFEESEQRKSLTENYISYQAKVEPHRLVNAQKDLKQMIYQNN